MQIVNIASGAVATVSEVTARNAIATGAWKTPDAPKRKASAKED